MSADPLPDDPLWPRAGGWPLAADVDPGIRIDLALIGVPTWRTSLSAREEPTAPADVRAALRRFSPSLMPDRSARTPLEPGELDLRELVCVDFGDVDEPDGPTGEARAIAAVADASERARLTVALGGDNALTFSTALGVWGEDLDRAGLITLDAHYDLRDGESNGSPVRRLIEAGLEGRRVVQIGIADFANSREYAQRAEDYGITVVHRDELHRRPMRDVMEEALHIAGGGGGPVHLDVDLDVCDRAVVPGCPAAVPGGLAAWEVREAVRLAASDPLLRSIDIAEVDAAGDSADGRTVRLAALCVLEALAGVGLR